MSGFLASAGVYVGEQSPPPQRRRARRHCQPPDRPAVPVPVLDGPLAMDMLAAAPTAGPPHRPWRDPLRTASPLRDRPESEDVDAMLAWRADTVAAGRPAARLAGYASLAYHDMPPAPIPPLPESIASGKPHRRPVPGRGWEGDDTVYALAWVGAAPLIGAADAARPHVVRQHGRAAITEDIRRSDLVSETWAGAHTARRPAGAAAKADRSGTVEPVRSWEGESLDWACATAVFSRPPRPSTAPVGGIFVAVAPPVELPWIDAGLSGGAARPGRRVGGGGGAGVTPTVSPTEQVWVAQGQGARGRHGARAGSVAVAMTAALYASHTDTLTGPDRGWLGGGVTLPVRAARAGRIAEALGLAVETVRAEPWVQSQDFARPVRVAQGGRGEYSTPDWHGAGLIAWAGPGHAVAGGVWYAGAVAGDVVEG